MDYLFGEYTLHKNILPLSINDIDSISINNDNEVTTYNIPNKLFKQKLLMIIKLFIFLNISWTIIATLVINVDKTNVLFQILYSIGYIILIIYIKKNKLNISYKSICITIILSICITILSIILFNKKYTLVPYTQLLSNNYKLFSFLMFFDYFYSYLIIFVLTLIFYDVATNIISLINEKKLFIYNTIFNESSNNCIIIANNICDTQLVINNSINKINNIYILFKIIGSICLCVTIIQIWNKDYNYINIIDVIIILSIELIYWKLYYKIQNMNDSIIKLINSPIVINQINNTFNYESWNFLNTIANNKINGFYFLSTNLAESSIVQQTIITVFGWIIAQKMIDILHI